MVFIGYKTSDLNRADIYIKSKPEFVGIRVYHVSTIPFQAYILNIPAGFESDLAVFKKGKYSKLSQEAKIHIVNGRDKDGDVFKSVYPTDKNRQDFADRMKKTLDVNLEVSPSLEMLSIPDMEKEIFYPAGIKLTYCCTESS